MRNILFLMQFLCCSFVMGQVSVLVPPNEVLVAFEKQYPKKNAMWSMETGVKEDDVKFVAKFNTIGTVGYAHYDRHGIFKVCKTVITFVKLPKNAQSYLKKNYGKSVRQVFSVLDNQGRIKYECEVKKEGVDYKIVFDNEGNFVKRIIISAY